jgi:lipid-A-disaccharide synthase-like uncharacterized protein
MTSWSVIGFAGTGLFASRWLVQLHGAHRAGRSIVTPAFWAISLCGSLLQAIYFGFGPHLDEVGLLGSALPFLTSLYNLVLALRSREPLISPPISTRAGAQASVSAPTVAQTRS